MNISQLLSDHNIPFKTEMTKNWINVHCPFCPGSRDFHLGISENGKASNCWRCVVHPIVETISAVLGVSTWEAKKLLSEVSSRFAAPGKREEAKVAINPFKYPSLSGALDGPWHRKYLMCRGFDPDKIAEEWGLLQTGPVSYLDDTNYSQRILAPITWNGDVVSFQSRDITGHSDRKYLACPKKREKIHHKNILYGKQEKWSGQSGLIVVEGITDVWRLGPAACATFGTAYKLEQVLQLSKHHDRFFIIFDNEPQAQKQARKLAKQLDGLGKQTIIQTVESDPGSMKQEDADYLIKELLR